MNRTFAEPTFQSASRAALAAAQVAEGIVKALRMVIASTVGQELRVLHYAISVEHNVLLTMVCLAKCAGSLAQYQRHPRRQRRLRHHLQHLAQKHALVVRLLHASVCAPLIQ